MSSNPSLNIFLFGLSTLYNVLELSVSSFVLHDISQVMTVEVEEVLSQGAYMLLYSRYSFDYVLKRLMLSLFLSLTLIIP